jgi:hypothetical protein
VKNGERATCFYFVGVHLALPSAQGVAHVIRSSIHIYWRSFQSISAFRWPGASGRSDGPATSGFWQMCSHCTNVAQTSLVGRHNDGQESY